jgi:Outer membrane protein/protective antigen OMA87
VKITNEPGSTPDRVVVVVDVEDQPTGSLSLSGGYSTLQSFIAEASVTETNFLGRGQYVRLGVSAGQFSRASSSVSPNPISSANGSRRASMSTRREPTPFDFRSTITS